MHSIKINKRMLFRKPIAFLFIILERDGRKKNIPFRTRRTRNIDPDPTHPKPDKTIHILQSSVYPYQCRWPKPPLTSAVSLNRIELSIVFFFFLLLLLSYRNILIVQSFFDNKPIRCVSGFVVVPTILRCHHRLTSHIHTQEQQ